MFDTKCAGKDGAAEGKEGEELLRSAWRAMSRERKPRLSPGYEMS